MAQQAWSAYKTYAWGHNELRPLTKTAHNAFVLGTQPLGATILDSIDTLYIMGLTKEYEDAKKWIAEEFVFDKASFNFVFCSLYFLQQLLLDSVLGSLSQIIFFGYQLDQREYSL